MRAHRAQQPRTPRQMPAQELWPDVPVAALRKAVRLSIRGPGAGVDGQADRGVDPKHARATKAPTHTWHLIDIEICLVGRSTRPEGRGPAVGRLHDRRAYWPRHAGTERR